MFGYITVNRAELKVKESAAYDAYYCGLCHALHGLHGRAGQLTLTYDMTFLVILLNGVYEHEMHEKTGRCLVHPMKKHTERWNDFSSYCADMNILLAYHNLLDDWQDDRKLSRYAAAQLLSKTYRGIREKYPRQHQAVVDYMKALFVCEKSCSDNVEEAACLTGKMLAEIFVCREDAWASDLRQMGFFLGKFIYLMDAYEDIEKDAVSGNYNPFMTIKDHENFDSECQNMLMMQMAECCRAFERLPIVQDAGILRNILYSGVWAKFASVYNKRNKAGENE